MTEHWSKRAACRNHDPELWFPHPSEKEPPARRICRQECPVAAQCLADALARDIRNGVLGGCTETERRAFRRMADRRAS